MFNFLIEMSASTEAIKLKFRSNKLVKTTVYNIQTREHLKKKTLDQADKIIYRRVYQMQVSTSY